MNNNKGQSLIENILVIPIICVVFVMIFFFFRIALTKQQLIMASKYGTDLMFYSNMSESEVDDEIKDYLCGENVKGRRLDAEKLTIISYKEVFPAVDSINLTLLEYFKDILYKPKDHASYVELSYEFEVPAILHAFRYIAPSNDNGINSLKVSARSEVLIGSGAKSKF